MSIMKYARWATLAAALSMPAAALAQEQPAPSQQMPTQQQPAPEQPSQQPSQNENPSTPVPQGTEGTQGQEAPKAKISQSETDTLAFLEQVNNAEIKAGKLAEHKGATTAVKDYGKTLVTDHEKMNEAIKEFAKQNKIKLPAKDKLPTEDQSQLRQLGQQETMMNKQKGAQFDTMFLQNMVQDHQQVLARVDAAASATQNPELQALLKDKIKPVLQAHQDRASELMKSNAQAMK